MIVIDKYTETIFEVCDKDGNITKVKRRFNELNNKLEWYFNFSGDARWENCDKKDSYNKIRGYSRLGSDFYSSESLETLYRNNKIDEILK